MIFLFINQRKLSVTRTCNEWPLAYETEHKTFKTMQNIIDANLLAQMASDQIEVNEVVNILDGMYQQMPCDDPEDRDYQLLVAANRLYKANDAEVSKFKNWTGTIEYHGFKIVVSRPKTFTWEQNTNPAVTSDPNHAIYLQQLALQEQINAQLKDMRADVKRTAEKLEKAHPESESIKRGFRLAFVPGDGK